MLTNFLACDKFLQGKPKKQEFIEVKKENLSCLKDLSKNVKSYLRAEISNKEIDDSIACLDTVLNEFLMRAEGTENAQYFTEDDVFKIFQTFLADAQISREATVDLLKLKKGLLGGSETKLMKSEMTHLRQFLQVLKPELHLVLPYARLFSFVKGDTPFSREMIDKGFLQLKNTLVVLLKASQLTTSEYRFEDFKMLIEHLKILESIPLDKNNPLDILGIANDVKNVLAGMDGLQTAEDFESIVDSLVSILRLQAIQNEGYVQFELKDAATLNSAFEFIESWINIFEKCVQFRNKGIISAETIDPLLIKLANSKFLSTEIKADTLVAFYKVLLVRVFEAGPGANINNFKGIKSIHLNNFKKDFLALRMYQEFINQVEFSKVSALDGSSRGEIVEIQKALSFFNFKLPKNSKMKTESLDQNQLISAAHELRQEFLSERPVVYRFNKMIVAVNQEVWQQNWQDLTKALFIKFLARELMMGWGNVNASVNASRLVKNATISEVNLIKWYEEFKAFGIETKAFDPRSVNSGARSFKEANLFSYAGDGNETMNYLETVQYINILISGGGRTLSELRDGFARANCLLNEMDVFGNLWIGEYCAFEDFKKNYKYYFNNLSYLSGFLSRLDDKQFADFYYEAMAVARINPATKGKLETGDLRTFAILLYYIESIYAQFDKDRNWTFSDAEIRFSYPRFKNFATDFAFQSAADKISLFNFPLVKIAGYYCYSQEDLIRESFIYLVYNGVTPGITDLNIAPCLRKLPLINFEGEVDRKTIIKTFKIMKAVLGS